MNYDEVDTFDDLYDEEEEVTRESAKHKFLFWKEHFTDLKKDERDHWNFYHNPFLDADIYAYEILTCDEKELLVH